MRSTLALIAFLFAPVAAAQGNARIEFLTKQLNSAKDPRARVQVALGLGATKDPAAVAPLCTAIKDSDPVVRSAVARALGDLRNAKAVPCLDGAKNDSDADVKAAVAK